jgi:hypothetical protein
MGDRDLRGQGSRVQATTKQTILVSMVRLPEALFGTRQTPRDPRIERLIAVARVALVVLALVALAIDPLEPPATNARIFYILVVYLGLSLSFAVIGFAGWRPNAWKVATHVADVGMAALLIDISALSVSPFCASAGFDADRPR